jgi:putative DNA primase/helicase
MERPEQRKFRGDPLGLVMAARGKYIAAALTIVSAWLATKEPDPVTPLASFEEWSHLVRSALIWLGQEDPVLTMDHAREEDADLQALRAVVGSWDQCVARGERKSAGELKAVADQVEITTGGDYSDRYEKTFKHPDFQQALLDVAYKSGEIDPKRFGRYLGRYQNRIVDGLKIMGIDDPHRKQKLWWLKPV